MTSNHKKIGRWHGAGLLATTLLGTSVFILPQMTVDIAGPWALWAWALLTLAILPVALVFAKLSSQYPHAAGPAFFVEKAFGVTYGRTIGMIFLCVVPIGAPAALLMTFQFADALFQVPEHHSLTVQLGFVALLFALNFKGLTLSATLQLALTLAITLIVAVLFGAFGMDTSNAAPSALTEDGAGLILSAAGLAFWSFLGIEAMSHLSGDFKRPEKDLVPAIMLGTGLVGLIYLACTHLVLIMPNDTNLHLVGVFNQLFANKGELIIGCLGIAGGLATVNVYTASLTRLIWSFANDGVLPKALRYQNRHGVALKALILKLSVIAVVLVITSFTGLDLEHLIGWANGVFAVIYFAAMLAAFKLLKAKYRWVTVLGCGFCFLMFWGLADSMLYVLGLIAVVTPLLWLQSKKQKNGQGSETLDPASAN